MDRRGTNRFAGSRGLAVVVWILAQEIGAQGVSAQSTKAPSGSAAEGRLGEAMVALVQNHCLDCHHSGEATSGVDLETLQSQPVGKHWGTWERVVKKLRSRQMPPAEADRPPEQEMLDALNALETTLDQHASEHPVAGRTETLRRLTRTEYGNAIADLLGLQIDVEALLPADEVSRGFDNITVGELSPTLINRYISAAQKISRLAVGRSVRGPEGTTFRIPPDVTQEEHVDGLPLGTRGGILISHTFPQDGEYEIRVLLTRDRNEYVEGLSGQHEMEILLDQQRLETFTIEPPKRGAAAGAYGKPSHANVDRHLHVRFSVTAGPHEVGVTFLKNPSSLLETPRQPLNVAFNMYRHPRLSPAVYEVSITGPYQPRGISETPSRERIFVCRPEGAENEEECAQEIIRHLMRLACRQPISDQDLSKPLALYQQGRSEGDFELGIEMALSSILVHPKFLFRVEREPDGVPAGTVYRISDLELASRLSFFIWSSLPDDELLTLAEQGRLSDPEVLEQQTRRLLADKRAKSLVNNFASQWLYLRNLDSITPDGRLYPDFDDNLRQAFRLETELFVESILREDRSVMDLLKADYTFLNERLAKHYGIPHIYGSRFRRVTLSEDSRRGGLLRHGSILTVTSYATRTSPVIRGKWILENIIGTPPPPPPDDVPALSDNTVSASLPVRQRLAQHRADPACASCHNLMDPVGFSLENFDAVGRWRELEEGRRVDATGGLPDGREFIGVTGLEEGLAERPELFVGTMAEKLLTYALGRGHEHFDAPAIRKVVRDAEGTEYRFSSLILGIVHSTPFQTRMTR